MKNYLADMALAARLQKKKKKKKKKKRILFEPANQLYVRVIKHFICF